MAGDDELLIGDDEPDDRLATAEPNPRSIFDGAARAALAEVLGDDVGFDEPMRRHTTARIGGPADAFARPSTHARLAALLAWCAAHRVPVTVVGGGSNLLVRDAGIRGVVLNTSRLRGLTLTSPTTMC